MHDLALRSLNVISLCAGGGGLDRALELAIPGTRSVVYVERESFAVASLVAQIENGLVAPAAVWSDVRTFKGRPWRGIVDCLVGGIPCQPHSLAGRRGGSTDERDLWSPARRLVVQIRPRLVVIENVGGFLSAGADEVPGAERVRRDLQKLGYAVTGCIVRASDVRLPHERERVFVIGVADTDGRQSPGRCLGSREAACGRTYAEPAGSGSGVRPLAAGVGLADSGCERLQGRGSSGGRTEGRASAERGGDELVHAQGLGRREGRSEPELRSRRRATDGASRALVHTAGLDRRLHQRPRQEEPGAIDATGPSQVVNAIGGGHDGRPESSLGRALGRDAQQLAGALRREQHFPDADSCEPSTDRRDDREGGPKHSAALPRGSRPALRPPGPGDAGAWRVIAEQHPDLLPALSSYDRLRIAMRDEGLAPDGEGSLSHRQVQKERRGSVGVGASRWVSADSGEHVHPAVIQAAAKRAVRRVADVMATRIDELRLLGNGVADAQGGLAIRIGIHDLATRGSAGAAELVRLMGEA